MPFSEGTFCATVLVVEDELSTRAGLAYVLQVAGFVVLEAGSAAAALERLEEQPALVLLDVGLPDIDGYTLCRRIKSNPATATVPVLLLSGLGNRSEERVHGLECGADGYLAKPAEMTEVVAQVKALLRLYRAEENLRDSELRYRELFEVNPHPMWVYEIATLQFLAVNDAAIDIYGYTRDEFLSMTLADIRPVEDIPALQAEVKEPAPRLQTKGIWRHRWKDGTIRHVEISSHALRFRGRAARLVLSLDITERRQAEEALREARAAAEQGLARLRTVVSSMTDGLVVADARGDLVEWNPAALRIHGFKSSDEVRRNFAALAQVLTVSPPGGQPLPVMEWPIARVIRGETITDLELLVRRTDTGMGRVINYSGAPVRGPDGKVELGVLMLHDVTERRWAEEELRRTGDLLRAVADGTTDAVFVKDRDGRYLLFNEAAARFVGRPAPEVLGKDDSELFDAEGAAMVMRRDRRVMYTGKAETEEENLTAAGVPRVYQATKAPYRDGQGNVIGIVGISREITERKRLEAERDELLARLQLQIERMPLAYVLYDASFRVIDWNPAAENLFGWRKEEVLDREVFSLFVAPSEMPRIEVLLQRLRARDMTAHSVNQNLTKDGRAITCRWFNTPLTRSDGTFAGVLSLAEDVTGQRRAEETLRLRERALESVSQGIVITDSARPDNPILYANPAFERLTGYARADVIGRNCRFLQGTNTDQAATAELRRAVRDGRACSVELLNYRKDGSIFWNAMSVSPVRDAAGNLTHFVGVQTDVTERRKLEEQYRQAQKMEVVGRLAGGIAHDFNNLLTVINGYGEMVLAVLPSGHAARDSVAEIVKSGERAAALTRQLLAFSRQQVLAPRVLNLNTVIAEMERMLRRVIGEDIELATNLHPALGHVRADPGQLEQVLLNLAVNARDAMPQGGKLTLETRDIDLDEAYLATHSGAQPGRYALLAVTDTGAGMTPDVRARVFEPFFTTKGPGKGTGLGLATVHGIVAQSGGRIEVYSEVGHGTTFKVYLPRFGGKPGTIGQSHSGATASPRGRETILLAEDEESVRALSRYVLRECGYAVLEAADGEEALEVCARENGAIHLLVSDVVMPGMGGRQLAARLLTLRPEMRVLYLSGYADDAVIRHGVLEAEVNFLQKPFSAVALASKVREVLDS
jgi:two-component system, cell cycle sensor histidine kinase and response regulator CckA